MALETRSKLAGWLTGPYISVAGLTLFSRSSPTRLALASDNRRPHPCKLGHLELAEAANKIPASYPPPSLLFTTLPFPFRRNENGPERSSVRDRFHLEKISSRSVLHPVFILAFPEGLATSVENLTGVFTDTASL